MHQHEMDENISYWTEEQARLEADMAEKYDADMEWCVDTNVTCKQRKYNLTCVNVCWNLEGDEADLFNLKAKLLAGLREKEELTDALGHLKQFGNLLADAWMIMKSDEDRAQDRLVKVMEAEASLFKFQERTHGWHIDYVRENFTAAQMELMPPYILNQGQWLNWTDPDNNTIEGEVGNCSSEETEAEEDWEAEGDMEPLLVD